MPTRRVSETGTPDRTKKSGISSTRLFPYVHGLSKVVDAPITVRDCLVNINCGTVRDSPICSPDPADTDEAVDKTFCSEKFQWLPADVQVSADGRAVFESYINNLHPQEYAQLYQVLGQIFSKFVPMFEKVLTDLLFPIRRPTTVELDEPIFEDSDDDDDNNEDDSDDDDSDNSENLGSADENTGDGAEQAAGGTIHEPPRQLANLAERRDADDQTGDRLNIDASSPFDRTNSPEVQRRLGSDDRELKESIDLFLPFDGAGTERGKLAVSLRNRKLQVIVKLANIELTVDAPDYGGGTWHVEGTNNERIVATGIYYYDVHNITQSKLDYVVAACGGGHRAAWSLHRIPKRVPASGLPVQLGKDTTR